MVRGSDFADALNDVPYRCYPLGGFKPLKQKHLNTQLFILRVQKAKLLGTIRSQLDRSPPQRPISDNHLRLHYNAIVQVQRLPILLRQVCAFSKPF